MVNSLETLLSSLSNDQVELMLITQKLLLETQKIFSDHYKNNINEKFDKYFDTFILKCYNVKVILAYHNMIMYGDDPLDVHVSEILTYTYLMRLAEDSGIDINKRINMVLESVGIKNIFRQRPEIFFTALNIILEANLRKVVDIYSMILYNLQLDQEFDHILMTHFMYLTLIYNQSWSCYHIDNGRQGQITCKSYDNSASAEDLCIPYIIGTLEEGQL